MRLADKHEESQRSEAIDFLWAPWMDRGNAPRFESQAEELDEAEGSES